MLELNQLPLDYKPNALTKWANVISIVSDWMFVDTNIIKSMPFFSYKVNKFCKCLEVSIEGITPPIPLLILIYIFYLNFSKL